MSRIIKNRQIVEGSWQVLRLAEGDSAETVVLPPAPVLLPLSVWLSRKDEIIAGNAPIGIWLDSHEDPQPIAGELDRFAVIGINFPKFADGRGYSTARLLRERFGFKGELRAIGDVLQDQLFYMKRCGIDAYAIRADKDLEAALASLNDFSETYQAAVDQPQPLFRRRITQRATDA